MHLKWLTMSMHVMFLLSFEVRNSFLVVEITEEISGSRKPGLKKIIKLSQLFLIQGEQNVM